VDLEDVPRLRTRRLELIAATPELARAAVAGNAALARALEVGVPDSWPPPMHGDAQAEMAAKLAADPSLAGWSFWFVVDSAALELVGSIGFVGHANDEGVVEIGYSMGDKYQRRGFATEAMGALIDWAFSHEHVRRVRAQTFPYLTASIRVLEKNGLSLVGAGDEPGTLRFELRRP
jgi:ribosomal-protein-alanine N-acetyltransferase